MTAAGQALLVARREAAALVRAPIALVVGVIFLIVQGFSFWAVVETLADPRRPAPVGAVLRTHFGGTFLYWAFLFFVVAVTTMRLVAEERRAGTWETLLTAPVGEGAVVVGKWLGALAFYAGLWLPTVSYVVILHAFAPAGGAPDAGPIATAYLGVLVSGAGFLALGLAASAATSSQIVAAQTTFAALLLLLLAGLAPEIAPDLFARHATLGAVARSVDLRRHMDDFARGIVDSRHLGFYAGMTAVGLAAALAGARAGRRGAGASARGAIGTALVLAAALLANVLGGRHPVRLDATAARVYSLEARTVRILREVRQPVQVVVLGAGAPEFAELYDEVRELLRAFQAAQPLIAVEELEPDLDPARVAELAERHHLAPEELAGGGAVVFTSGARRRAVALLDMAEFAADGRTGAGALRSFHGEAEFAAAVLDVSDEDHPEICFTTGHGEAPLAASPGGPGDGLGAGGEAAAVAGRDLAALVAVLEQDAARPVELPDLSNGVPARCRAVAIVGPTRALPASEAIAIDRHLADGGRLLVAVDPEAAPIAGRLLPTGLEIVLADRGVRLPPALVVDPSFEVGVPLAWGTLRGYGDHPVSAAFQGRRATVWFAPRWVDLVESRGTSATALVQSSSVGWGETDLAGLRARPGAPEAADERDVPGPLAVAVAVEKAPEGSRLVVFGSARSFTSDVLGRQLGVNDALFASAVAWLTGRTKLAGIRPKTPEQFRVVMTRAQVRRLFWAVVLLLPAAVGAAGGALAWRRGRER